jgi:hypothetical protein
MRGSLLVALLLAAGGAACTGTIDGVEDGSSSGLPSAASGAAGGDAVGAGGTGGGPAAEALDFECDPDLVAPQLPLRRLSRVQRESTIRDLVRWALPGDDAEAVIAAVEPTFAQIPVDQRVGHDIHYARFSRLDQALQQEHVDAAYELGRALGAAIAEDPARLAAVAGDCATNADAGDDDGCLDDFIRGFGERALRAAVTDDDVAFYRDVAGAAPFDAADWSDVVALLVNAPRALYLVEVGEGGDDASAPLGAYELASRLSYHFWQTMPDAELFDVARNGTLTEDAVWEAQVDRVFDDPRTRDAMGSFFGEWLENSTLEELDSRVGTVVFDAFRGDFEPGPELREHMLQEVTDAAVHYAVDASGSWEDFLLSRASFARTDDLASIYGVPTWSPGEEPPAMTDPARVGLITRAAYVATGSANTRPIMKGVFLRKALLCDTIDAPPAEAAANPPMLSEDLTTREVVEELTGEGVCAGCHLNAINPLGFATENFDALGRVRSEQTFYDEETGDRLGASPIDTASVPQVELGDEAESAGAADLLDLIAASEKPHACFARQYFRFTFGRFEDPEVDGCALALVDDALDEGLPMAEALRAMALAPSFRRRSFVGEGGQ